LDTAIEIVAIPIGLTDPTKSVLAKTAGHVLTALIFFDVNSAERARLKVLL
jgi:hypothetical protein